MKRNANSSRITEVEVGILAYVNPDLVGFQAVVKSKPSDFQVNEVDLEGRVAGITLEEPLPPEPITDDVKEQENEMVKEKEGREKLKELVGIDTFSQLEALVEGGGGGGGQAVRIQVESLEKPQRTAIHVSIKELFQQALVSKTLSEEGVILVEARAAMDKQQRRQAAAREAPEFWIKRGGDFCRFCLYKENKDTIEAISIICRSLGLHAKVFGYAGTKDRKAWTNQWVTAYRVKPEKLSSVNSQRSDLKLGNFSIVDKSLKLGELKGNQFVLVLREISCSEEILSESFKSLLNNGFLNYFGLQRFGSSSLGTNKIGSALLRKAWKEAVDLILMPREGEAEDFAMARSYWQETGDPCLTLSKFPRRAVAEIALLQFYAKQVDNRNNHAGALFAIPRNLRMMYVHAYQSYLWNQACSERFRLYGTKVVVGDLIGLEREADEKVMRVKLLTEKDDLTCYTIEQVVLPIPGWEIQYPTHELREYYQCLIKQDGLDTLGVFAEKDQSSKTYCTPGSYRYILAKPQELRWESIEGNIRLWLTLGSSQYCTMALREIMR